MDVVTLEVHTDIVGLVIHDRYNMHKKAKEIKYFDTT